MAIEAKLTEQIVIMEEPQYTDIIRALAACFAVSIAQIGREALRAGLDHVRNERTRQHPDAADCFDAILLGMREAREAHEVRE